LKPIKEKYRARKHQASIRTLTYTLSIKKEISIAVAEVAELALVKVAVFFGWNQED